MKKNESFIFESPYRGGTEATEALLHRRLGCASPACLGRKLLIPCNASGDSPISAPASAANGARGGTRLYIAEA